jgi:tRNA(Ile)-lysidine synthase
MIEPSETVKACDSCDGTQEPAAPMSGNTSRLTIEFAAAMEGIGPFEPRPALALAVSGGPDSMAMAILARDWVRQHDGSALALVVDHGLRPNSAHEARITIDRLTRLDIPARLLSLANLTHGPALAERARIMRYELLTDACRELGILHLLLGHHAADQAETLAMRVLRGSLTHGLAGMPALRETAGVRLLRPLLGIEPARLRHFLTTRRTEWVEDPSNRDIRALRPRLRRRIAAETQVAPRLAYAMSLVAHLRSKEEAETAAEIATRVTIRPEGFALLSPGRIGSAALSNLIRTIGGSAYNPSPDRINDLAAQPGPATVAGVRIMQAGRFGEGLLIVREEAAVKEPVPARPGAIWDGRFRLAGCRDLPQEAMIGKLGADAARFRAVSDLPSAVLRTLPAVRFSNFLSAVPHLGYAVNEDGARMTVSFTPPSPLAGACFVPAA